MNTKKLVLLLLLLLLVLLGLFASQNQNQHIQISGFPIHQQQLNRKGSRKKQSHSKQKQF